MAATKRAHDFDSSSSAKKTRPIVQLNAEPTGQDIRTIDKLRRTIITSRYNVSHNLNTITGVDDLIAASDAVTEWYATLIEQKLNEVRVESYDWVSVMVEHDDLTIDGVQKPIYIQYRKKSNLRHSDFIEKISSVVQSNEKFMLDGNMTMTVRVIKPPQNVRGRPSKNLVCESDAYYQQKKSVIIINNPNDDLCGFYALALGRWIIENPYHTAANNDAFKTWKNILISLKRGLISQKITNITRKFCMDAGLTMFQPLELSSIHVIQERFKDQFQIAVFERPTSSLSVNRLFVGNSSAEAKVVLEYVSSGGVGHVNLIKSVQAYLDTPYYCWPCGSPYRNKYDHICKDVCQMCRKSGSCADASEEGGEMIDCEDCGGSFYGNQCYEAHIELTKICGKRFKCPTCCVIIPKKFEEKHQCGTYLCHKCNEEYEDSPHYCCLKAPKEEKLQEDDENLKIMVFFDIESYMDNKQMGPSGRERFDHVANLLVSHVSCDRCWDQTTKSRGECLVCGPEEYVYESETCVKQFCDDLYKKLAPKAANAKGRVYVYSHNYKAYDGRFILTDLFRRKMMNTKLIMAGSKIMKLRVGNVIFQDSLNYFQQPLAALPKAFGFEDKVVKGTFCHDWNQPKYFDYIGPVPPLPESPYMKLMKESEATKLRQWHKHLTEINYVFNVREELIKYCRADVEVLKIAVQEFRSLYKDITGLDPITRCCTLAGIALEVFRVNHLKDSKVGITPIAGYAQRMSSRSADVWMDMIAKTENITIEREYRIGNKWADGYCKATKTAYEYWGCAYHGCLRCYEDREQPIFVNGEDKPPLITSEVYKKVEDKRELYENLGITLVEKWGCDFYNDNIRGRHADTLRGTSEYITEYDDKVRWCKDEIERRKKIKLDLGDKRHANIRESFYGGRTNNLYFEYKCEKDEWIEYLDFTSLYPWVLSTMPYPVGHPKVITHGFEDNDISRYFGFIKCKVITNNNYLPVLPQRINGKLCFANCDKCALNMNQGECTHIGTAEEGLIGTWTTPELKKAIEQGCQVVEIYKVLHYEQQSDQIFASYIKDWLKIKTESSGWPPDVQTDEEKDAYIEAFKFREGIDLDRTQIFENKGRRLIAKLMLNSLWGKLAERANQPQTAIFTEFAEQAKIIEDPKNEILGEIEVYRNDDNDGEGTVLLTYRKVSDEDCSPRNTALAIASFVTAYGRLKLLEKMIEIESSRGVGPSFRVLYFDTDSIIYAHKDKVDTLLPRGNFLGQLTDEVLGHTKDPASKIKRFYALGPKNYCYIIVHPDGREESVVKCKGITMNGLTNTAFTESKLKTIIDQYVTGSEVFPIVVRQLNILGEKHSTPFTRIGPKVVQPTGDKRLINFNDWVFEPIRGNRKVTLPYGTCVPRDWRYQPLGLTDI